MGRESPFRPSVQRLEAREVPAAGVLAEIVPGIWGSYPRSFEASGDRLYFTAENGHVDELYVSDGTAAGTRMVKEIRPGAAGANIEWVVGAGNGVAYFLADDGAGPALWRTEGTQAGTTNVPGLPTDAQTRISPGGGIGGSLYFSTWRDGTNSHQIWVTDGTNTTQLLSTWTSTLGTTWPYVKDGKVYIYNEPKVWETDGTPAGTRVVSDRASAVLPDGTTVVLGQMGQVAPGRWLFSHTDPDGNGYDPTGNANSISWLWVRDGATGPPRLLKSFDGMISTFGHPGMISGGKLAFWVITPSQQRILWVSDGTAGGTRPVGTLADGSRPADWHTTFGGRFVAGLVGPSGVGVGVALTDGTAAGTARLAAPDGAAATGYLGKLSPSAAHPDGLLVLRAGGRVFVTAGTAGSARWVDTTGVTQEAHDALQASSWGETPYAAQVNGSVYYRGPRVGDVRPEPWKWDLLAAPAPPQATGPIVASVTVNGGSGQRSMVTKVTVAFDRAVTLADGAFNLQRVATGQAVGLRVSTQVVGGRTVATVTFAGTGIVGGSLADGVYKFTVDGGKVRTAGTTAKMVGTHTTSFHRLFGDLDADRRVGTAARWMVHDRLGATRGDADYLSGLDYDGDGDSDAGDEYQILKRLGKSV